MAMTKEQQALWKAEKYGYSKAFTAIKGDTVRVSDIESYHAGQIGYTSADHVVHLAYDHPCMKGLNDNGKHAFRCGVGVHELMHQLLTDFVITNRQINSLPGIEQDIYAMLSNYVEDARIEHFAYQFVGGIYLKCLDFAIAWTYKTSQKIQEGNTPFEQFMIAVQQFGDMGLLKGRFTFPEAKEAFYKAVPIYYNATCEVNPRRVMKYTKEIFEISRPLWKDQKDLEELMRKMQEAAEKSGHSMHGKGEGGKASTEASEEGEGSESGASARRKMTMKEVSRRTFEEAQESAGSGSGSGSGTMMKCKDAKTAEEAQEAAEEAAEDAQQAQDAANDAKDAANDAKGSENESRAQKAAEKAQRAADRAKKAAEDAANHADAASKAKASGDSKAEEENAKQSGKDALRANAAMKSAENACDEANGRSTGSEKSETAQDAAENAADAQASADAAEAAAQEAEAKAQEAAESGDSEGAAKAQKAAEKAREAADKAQAAADKAKESAEKAEAAQESEDELGESANARNAQSAAREAAREAAKAENAANGKNQNTPGEEANDAVTSDYSQAQPTDPFSSDASDRAINGARPDYSNCADEVDDGDDYDPTPTEFDYEDYVLTDDDFTSIETEVKNCLDDVKREESDASKEEATPLPDFEITSSRIGKAATCLNRRVKVDDVERAMELYGNLMTKLRPGVNSLYGRLRNIFQNDLEVTDYRSSGKLNFKRVNSGRMTARVFDKHRLPSEKAKTAVMILVDESGSMSGSNARTAKETAIALSETFYRLNIPTYVIGFTADTSGADAVHNHYVTWKNSMNERLRLLDITARANNFDGYSIRYGGEILKRVNAEHKLMIVVSDGSPACSYYYGLSGVADTKDAIRSVRKDADVLGVLIGPYDVEDLQSMYGNDFINVKHVDELFASIAKRIVHIVNKWD